MGRWEIWLSLGRVAWDTDSISVPRALLANSMTSHLKMSKLLWCPLIGMALMLRGSEGGVKWGALGSVSDMEWVIRKCCLSPHWDGCSLQMETAESRLLGNCKNKDGECVPRFSCKKKNVWQESSILKNFVLWQHGQDLVCLAKWEKSDGERLSTVWYHSYVESKKARLLRTEVEWWLPGNGGEGWGTGTDVV